MFDDERGDGVSQAIITLRWQIKGGITYGLHKTREGLLQLISIGTQLADLLELEAEKSMLEFYEYSISSGAKRFEDDVPCLLDVLVFTAENSLRLRGIKPNQLL